MLKIPTVLCVVYADPVMVVVDKPSGVLSVPGRGPEKQACVSAQIRAAHPGCPNHPAAHRLDMDTSGLLVFGLTAASHRHLSLQFQNRTCAKAYVALLDGVPEEAAGTVELPFRLDIDNRPTQIYDPVHGKWGITHWEILGVENGRARVRMVPETGRTHQLRVHAAHPKGLGIPIVGDPLYGTGTGPGQLKLHAAELSLDHPDSGERLTFHAPTPF